MVKFSVAVKPGVATVFAIVVAVAVVIGGDAMMAILDSVVERC